MLTTSEICLCLFLICVIILCSAALVLYRTGWFVFRNCPAADGTVTEVVPEDYVTSETSFKIQRCYRMKIKFTYKDKEYTALSFAVYRKSPFFSGDPVTVLINEKNMSLVGLKKKGKHK